MRDVFRHFFMAVDRLMLVIIKADHHDVKVKRWSSKPRLVKLNKRLGHALALPSLAAVLRPLAKALRLFVQLDETQSLYDTFDPYI